MDQDGSAHRVLRRTVIFCTTGRLCGRIKTIHLMDQDGSAHSILRRNAIPVLGEGFVDGSRRSIGWIKMDSYMSDLAQLVLPANNWAMDQDDPCDGSGWISTQRTT